MDNKKRKEKHEATETGETVKIFSLRTGDIHLPDGSVLKHQQLKDVPAALADYLLKCFPTELKRV